MTESTKISKRGKILSFEKRAANKDNEASELSKEQKDLLMSELLNRKMLLDYSCGMVNHTQDGIYYLLKMTESANKLFMDMNTRLPQCREDRVLDNSIQRLEYSIRLMLKKVKEIRDHVKSNTERQVVAGETQVIAPRIRAPAATTNAVVSFAELLPPSRNFNYILPDFTALESHPAGTITAPIITTQIPMMTSTGHAASMISGPGKHSIAGLFGDIGRRGFSGGAG